ncbi:hypothetical protein ACN28E_35735 [Archangium lansingense]
MKPDGYTIPFMATYSRLPGGRAPDDGGYTLVRDEDPMQKWLE